MFNFKKLSNIAIASTVVFSLNSFALSADEIMKASDDRYTGDTSISESVLTLIDKRDRQRVRDLKLFSIEKDDVEKSMIFFMSPSDVAGTAYLSFDWEEESKEDDSWLYLPALQKVKRVAASDESGAFMGSDFSYADINGLDYEDFDYSLLKESEIVDGIDCWVIESTPKSDDVLDKTGYNSAQTWVRKDNYMQIKSIIQVEKGKKTKYFSASDIKEVQGVWTAHTLQMVTTRNNKKEHASVLKFNNVRYNEDVQEDMFDTQAMQRGI